MSSETPQPRVPHRDRPFAGGMGAWAVRALAGDAHRPAAEPHLPDGRADRRYLTAAGIAAAVCLIVASEYLGPRVLMMAAIATVVGTAVELVFAFIRKRIAGGGAIVFGLLLALIVPADTPLWMVAAAAAFAVALGKEAFGGTGYQIFQPVLIGKAFLMISYPTAVAGLSFGAMVSAGDEAWIVASILLLVAAGGMVVARPGNVWILGGIGIAGGGMAWLLAWANLLPDGISTPLYLLAGGDFLLIGVLLATDPAVTPNGRIGRFVYGLVIGALAIVMTCFGNYGHGMLWAVLVGNLAAPLIDAIGLPKPAGEAVA